MKSLLEDTVRKSRMPARLDLLQSLSGLVLGVFMWIHLVLVSSILLGKGAMNGLSRFMELSFLKAGPGGYAFVPWIIALGVFIVFILHAGLAMRKFPATWKQNKIFRSHMKMMHHSDTTLWYVQVVTGFIMFFLGSVHLYVMLTNPGNIGPYASADRFVTDWMAPLFLILLFAVELHAAIGMYRLAIKWGILDGDDPHVARKKFKKIKNITSAFFLTLGILSWIVYVTIGVHHRDHAGERYQSSIAVETTFVARG